MPLLLKNTKSVTFEINAVKVLSTPNDNDLNTTTLFPYEGFYESSTGKFTPLQPMDEHILGQSTYEDLMRLAKTYYDQNLTGDPMGIYLAQKVIMYDWLANEIGETGYTIV
jgi:hypothetical protein